MKASDDRPVARSRPRPAPDAGQDPIGGSIATVPREAVKTPAPTTPAEPMTRELSELPAPGPAPSRKQKAKTRTAPPSPPVRRGPVPTVQLNTRVAVDVAELIEDAAAATGQTKRELIEQAIRDAYAS